MEADDAAAAQLAQVLKQPGEAAAGAVVELSLRGVSGAPVPVDFNITPRRDGPGRLLGHVLVGRPMGELKRATTS